MTPKEFRRKMEKIQRRFAEIEETYNDLPLPLREEINDYHNPNFTLVHCIRWGVNATNEIIEDFENVHDNAVNNYDEF